MSNGITKDLMERRVPQYLAAYLAGSWILVEFFAFLEERFLLSPHLTNLVLLLLLLMLPSVALFTYFHGRRGPDRWQRVEKVFIPLNAVVTVGVLAALFAGRDLGAMTTTVTVEGPDGTPVERTVAKSEFRKGVVLFPFALVKEDADAQALGTGVLNVLAVDLVQDSFIDARTPATYRDKARNAGYEVTEVPRPLRRRITRELNIDHFLDGKFSYDGAIFRLSLLLHDAERGGVVAAHDYENEDLMALIDAAAIQLRKDLGLPARYIEETLDLPARDHATASIEALQAYGYGDLAVLEQDDFQAAREAMQRATDLDPTYAVAGFQLYRLNILIGDVAAATDAIRNVMDHVYRMPERFQFAVRAEWYAMQQDLPKAFAVYEMWAELYPQDLDAQLYSAQVRTFQGDREGALAAFEKALDLDPTRLDIIEHVGDLNEQLGKPDAARSAYEQMIEAQPGNETGLVRLARLENRVGNHDEARALFERASLMDPGNVGIINGLADLYADTGEFDAAEAAYERALAGAKTPQQRWEVLRALRSYHAYRGAYSRALDYQLQGEAAAAVFQPPLPQVQLQLMGLRTYVHAGQAETALERLEALSSQLQAPMDALAPIGRVAVHEAIGDAEALALALDDARAMLERTGLNSLQRDIVFGQGRLHEIRGEWEAAIAAYEEERRLSPTDTEIPLQLGRVYRAKGDLEAAERHLRETLTAQPSNGRANYELALVHEARGRNAKAIEHLERAMDTWAPADEAYAYPARARQKLAELNNAR
ncbi:tetratricopeptide repeat protein [Wenzhouxiangella sp. XN24]|uniref:tetratricopeptide repeat protein n=1 Tax=Wenzhouxiangella sp. XN24 TaxID=2713569 RepID=UPI0013ECFEFE|nr:tetratricopeptide repeat protein [Wenzhouxiangella sp. XN24]NGX17171.1 tetratricopeptide repeat protein [Wenzhouxiangella sp. XN24]